jgi:hypothetical protein
MVSTSSVAHTDRAKRGPWHPAPRDARGFSFARAANRESRTVALGTERGLRSRYEKVMGTCARTGRSVGRWSEKMTKSDQLATLMTFLLLGYGGSVCFHVYLVGISEMREVLRPCLFF